MIDFTKHTIECFDVKVQHFSHRFCSFDVINTTNYDTHSDNPGQF